METLKILMSTIDYPPPTGGIQSIVYNTEKGLRSLGHEVKLCCFDEKKIKEKYLVKDFLFSKATFNRYFWLNHKSRKHYNFIFRKFKDEIKNFQPDISHVMHPYLSPVFAADNVPSLLTCYAMELQNIYPVNYSLRQATKIHALSQFTKDLILKLAPEREQDVIVINPPTNTEIFNKKLKRENNIITVCRLVDRKNVANCINAFSLLPRKLQKSYQYLIVGNGPELAHLKRLKKRLKLENIKFAGEVTDQGELSLLLLKSKLFVMCPLSLKGLNIEGFGVVYTEAKAAGLPIIASKTGAVPEAVGKSGIFVENETDPKEIAEKIEKVLSNKKVRQSLEKNTRKEAEKLSNKIVAKQFVKVYKQLER